MQETLREMKDFHMSPSTVKNHSNKKTKTRPFWAFKSEGKVVGAGQEAGRPSCHGFNQEERIKATHFRNTPSPWSSKLKPRYSHCFGDLQQRVALLGQGEEGTT